MSTTPASILRIPGDVLDYYLGLGYYRMGQDLFTCRFLPVGNNIYTVHWLRLEVARVAYGSKQRQLLRRNEQFAVTVKRFQLTEEYEALFAHYRQAIAFDTAASLKALLLAGNTYSVFDTQVIEVRDNGQLIAAGIFDSGTSTIAGIVNFYDPDYRKYSLGKYLLLLKLDWARRHQKEYYYPGYLVSGYTKFDYKLFASPEATEVFDCLSSQWLPFSWEEVARQSAALAGEGLRQSWGEEAE